MKGEFLKGNVKDVCAELEAEAKRYKGITFAQWLKIRAIEKAEAKQFGMTVEQFRGCMK